MPPIRTSKSSKTPPEGFDDLEDMLLEFANKMKDGKLIPLIHSRFFAPVLVLFLARVLIPTSTSQRDQMDPD